MQINTFLKSIPVLAVVWLVTSCASATKYETETLKVYVDRETVDNMDTEDIYAIAGNIQQMKNERKLSIGIFLSLKDESQGRARLPENVKLEETAYNLAMNYLDRVKAYKMTMLQGTLSEDELVCAQAMKNPDYHFLIGMNVALNSEIEERYDFDEAMYKTSIDWTLIDNRTKLNGLGNLDAPTRVMSLTCKNVTSRKLKVSSLTNRRMGGSHDANSVNAYRITLENALIEFRAQLANRLPFGGKIESFKELDGDISMVLKSGINHGIQKRMQMVIINEEGDYIAVATAYPMNSTEKTRLQVWRWLSSSMRKQIRKIAENNSSREWMDEEGNALYAVCLGLPSPSKDERDQIRDYE